MHFLFKQSWGIKQTMPSEYMWVHVLSPLSRGSSYWAGLSNEEDWQSIGPDHAIDSDWEVCPDGQAVGLQHGLNAGKHTKKLWKITMFNG